MPSQSLIKIVCYPEAFKFSTAATRFVSKNFFTETVVIMFGFRWGWAHEQNAIETYSLKAKHSHTDIRIMEAGLFIDSERPFLQTALSPVSAVERV